MFRKKRILKASIVLIFVMLLPVDLLSQSALPVGKAQLNAGVGLSGWGVPFYFGIDKCVKKDITIGAELLYRSYHENWRYVYYNHTILGLSANGNYHFNSLLNIPRKWDLYAGLNIGFYFWNSPERYPGTQSSGLGLGAQLGGRYYLSDKLGLNLEFGSNNAFSGGKFGVTLKL